MVVRYFIDEAMSGVAPTQLTDVVTSPMHLNIAYDASLMFDDPGGHRALAWSAIEADGRASLPLLGSKLYTALSGSEVATIEAVVDIKAISAARSRIVHVGGGNEDGHLTLSATPGTVWLFVDESTPAGTWSVDLTLLGRVVVHAVFDSQAPTAADRATLYVNGQLATNVSSGIEQGYQLAPVTSDYLVIGNREQGARSPEGTIHYAAIYERALTQAQATTNALALQASDDL